MIPRCGSPTRCFRIGRSSARARRGLLVRDREIAAERHVRAGPGGDEHDCARLAEESPGAVQRGISVVPLSVHVTGAKTRQALWTLTGAVSLVLLMAVANIAGLSLARSAGREREIAIRSALGASQAHIVRQVLVESVTLAIIAGCREPDCGEGRHSPHVVARPGGLDRLDEVSARSLGIRLRSVLSLFAGVLVGLAPAITTTRRDLKPAFQDGGRERIGRSGDAHECAAGSWSPSLRSQSFCWSEPDC